MRRIVAKLIVVVALASPVSAEQPANKKVSPEVKARIYNLVKLAEEKKNSPGELNRTILDLNGYLHKCWNTDVVIPTDATSAMTKQFVAIFWGIDDHEMNKANRLRIIELIGQWGNTTEAHEFIFQMMESQNKEYQEMALWAIGDPGVHGNDVYDRIQMLMSKGVVEKEKFLYSLKAANKERALKEIQNFLIQTTSQKQFVRKGLLLCEYRNPELLDVLVDRYDEFKKVVPKSAEERAGFTPARAAFDPVVLRKYLDIREGKRFRTALEVLGAKGIFENADLPLLEKKLQSADVSTREAVIDFLEHTIENYSLNQDKVLTMLRKSEKREKDTGLKNKLALMIKARNKTK